MSLTQLSEAVRGDDDEEDGRRETRDESDEGGEPTGCCEVRALVVDGDGQ